MLCDVSCPASGRGWGYLSYQASDCASIDCVVRVGCGKRADRGGSVSQLRPVSTVNNAVCRSSQQQIAQSFYLPPDEVEKQ